MAEGRLAAQTRIHFPARDSRLAEGGRQGRQGLAIKPQQETMLTVKVEQDNCPMAKVEYDAWRRELDLPSLTFGAFGENFTIEGLTESDVCLGDVWRVGAVEVQVSQPRQPCWKLARRWQIEDLALRVVQNGRTGWYFRVLREGVVASGLALERLDRPFPRWTIERANRVLHHDKTDLAAAAELAAVATLPAPLRASLARRIEREPGGSDLVGRRFGVTAHD
jgi:MOSC domain-containing protein YiiM